MHVCPWANKRCATDRLDILLYAGSDLQGASVKASALHLHNTLTSQPQTRTATAAATAQDQGAALFQANLLD
jgi:hypothetical protein